MLVTGVPPIEVKMPPMRICPLVWSATAYTCAPGFKSGLKLESTDAGWPMERAGNANIATQTSKLADTLFMRRQDQSS
jgi:hypothetical protein